MTLTHIITQITNGDVPSFLDLAPFFAGMDLWHIRNACFGDSNAAQAFCALHDLPWQVGYDNRAVVRMEDGYEVKAISVTPSHALIVAALTAIEMKKARAGT